MVKTGIIVINIPMNSLATSVIGNHVNPFSDLTLEFVYFTLKKVITIK